MEEFYNKKEIYKEKVEPILRSLMRECALENIPAFATFAVENTEKDTSYFSDMVSAKTNGVKLKADRIKDCANIVGGGFDITLDGKVVAEDNILEIPL